MDQQTPKSRARKIIKAWMANNDPSATIENDLFMAIANEIADAENRVHKSYEAEPPQTVTPEFWEGWKAGYRATIQMAKAAGPTVGDLPENIEEKNG